MSFIPINFEEGHMVDLPMTAATYTKGQALTCTSGYYVTFTGAGEVMAICMEGIVIATTGNTAKCIITRGPRFLADTAATVTQTQVGTECDLSTALLLDTSATSNNNFYIEKAILPLTDKKVIGYFKHENLNA